MAAVAIHLIIIRVKKEPLEPVARDQNSVDNKAKWTKTIYSALTNKLRSRKISKL